MWYTDEGKFWWAAQAGVNPHAACVICCMHVGRPACLPSASVQGLVRHQNIPPTRSGFVYLLVLLLPVFSVFLPQSIYQFLTTDQLYHLKETPITPG